MVMFIFILLGVLKNQKYENEKIIRMYCYVVEFM